MGIALMIRKTEEHKEIVQAIYDEAKNLVILVSVPGLSKKEGWNPGVLGYSWTPLEELGQTVIVLNIEDSAKGSTEYWQSISLKLWIIMLLSTSLWWPAQVPQSMTSGG